MLVRSQACFTTGFRLAGYSAVALETNDMSEVLPARRTHQDYWPLRPLLFERKGRYQSRVPEQIRESRRARFFRPLLYQLSYLGESVILLGNS
jgi:hypothetical protein